MAFMMKSVTNKQKSIKSDAIRVGMNYALLHKHHCQIVHIDGYEFVFDWEHIYNRLSHVQTGYGMNCSTYQLNIMRDFSKLHWYCFIVWAASLETMRNNALEFVNLRKRTVLHNSVQLVSSVNTVPWIFSFDVDPLKLPGVDVIPRQLPSWT